jgi:hypothetical protein
VALAPAAVGLLHEAAVASSVAGPPTSTPATVPRKKPLKAAPYPLRPRSSATLGMMVATARVSDANRVMVVTNPIVSHRPVGDQGCSMTSIRAP